MRAKGTFQLFGFVVLAMLTTGFAQVCVDDESCPTTLCCGDTNYCSTIQSSSKRLGEAAVDSCECASYFIDEDTGLCACDHDNDCTDSFCCMENGECSTRDESSVVVGGVADDSCECSSGYLREIYGICGSSIPSTQCVTDASCNPFCCMSNGQCSANEAGSIFAFGAAQDACECASGLLDATTGLCGLGGFLCGGQVCDLGQCCKSDNTCSTRPAYSVPYGSFAEDSCECQTGFLNPATGGCGCRIDSHCNLGCCVRDTNICSINADRSQYGGAFVQDRCECKSYAMDSSTNLCICKNDDGCEGDTCCMDDRTCSGQDAKSVYGGRFGEDKCVCMSENLKDPDTCECLNDDHCFFAQCCVLATSLCSVNMKASLLEGAAAKDKCECKSEQLKVGEEECACTEDEDCTEPYCCMVDFECSSRTKESVAQGGDADDKCECMSDMINDDGICECADDQECDVDEICCPEDKMCGPPGIRDPTACGDPHMTGFHGQKFDFTGNDGGWYALVSDPLSMHLNMRVTAPVPSLPEITYITGLSLLTKDDDGVDHTVVISVKDPHTLDSACPADLNPCLADGSLSVAIDGDMVLMAPGTVTVGPGIRVTAVNIPGECRSFGFETYWEKKKMEYARSGRRLLNEALSIGEWVLADPTATNLVECATYVARAMSEEDGMFAHQSEHASFQIVTPTGTIRLSHGRLHQLTMRDPTDRYDLPDHLTWQMNMGLDHTDISHDAQGILGETFVPTLDDKGNAIMHGMECIRGTEEDYSVHGPVGVIFSQKG